MAKNNKLEGIVLKKNTLLAKKVEVEMKNKNGLILTEKDKMDMKLSDLADHPFRAEAVLVGAETSQYFEGGIIPGDILYLGSLPNEDSIINIQGDIYMIVYVSSIVAIKRKG